MDMEMSVEMNETVERLAGAVGVLEAAVARLSGLEMQAVASASAVDELESKLAAAEARIEELSARGAERLDRGGDRGFDRGFGRKTLLAKGASAVEGLEGVLDGALASLSLEQRIAVKSELMRGGLLG